MGKLKIKDHPIGHLVPMESRVISDREVEAPKGATVKEHRTPEQREANEKGHFVYLVGTDKGMSGWGHAPRRSRVAVPVGPDDVAHKIKETMRRGGVRRISAVTIDGLKRVIQRLEDGDHLSIYNHERSHSGW